MEGNTKICCLHRKYIGNNNVEHELIELSGKSKVTIGRATVNDIIFGEVPCISRQHAVLKRDENGHWTVMDLNSSNGIHINGTKITPGMEVLLKDRDLVEIGKDPRTNQPAHYRYTFYRAAKLKIQQSDSSSTNANTQDVTEKFALPPPLKRVCVEMENISPMTLVRQKMAEQERLLREEMLKKEKEAEERLKEMEARMAEMNAKMIEELEAQKAQESKIAKEREEIERRLKEAEEEASKSVKELQEKLKEKEFEKEETAEALKQEKSRIEEELEKQRMEREHLEKLENERAEELAKSKEAAEQRIRDVMQELEREKEAFEAQEALKAAELEKGQLDAEKRMSDLQNQFQEKLREEQTRIEKEMKEKLDKEMKEKEENLKLQLSNELEQLQKEREQVELSMKEQDAKEKIKEAEYEELRKQQEALNKVIAEKELKHQQLEDQLRKTKSEAEAAAASGLEVKNQLVTRMEDLMETELLCAICSELFVQTMSLNCSHSFCTLCITQWMDRKKECPNCRSKITSCVRSLVLDNYIDKMTDHLSDELKERRRVLIKERKEEQAQYEAKTKSGPAATNNVRPHPLARPPVRPATQPRSTAAATAQTTTASSTDSRRSLEAVMQFAHRHDYVQYPELQRAAGRGVGTSASSGAAPQGRGGAANTVSWGQSRNPFVANRTSTVTSAANSRPASTASGIETNNRGRNGRRGRRGGSNNNNNRNQSNGNGQNTQNQAAQNRSTTVNLTSAAPTQQRTSTHIDLTNPPRLPLPVSGVVDLTRMPPQNLNPLSIGVTTANGRPMYYVNTTGTVSLAGYVIPRVSTAVSSSTGNNANITGRVMTAYNTASVPPGTSLINRNNQQSQRR